MSKIDAPAIEPTANQKAAKPPVNRPRGRYIDFAPRHPKKSPEAEKAEKSVGVVAPVISENLTIGDMLNREPEPVVEETVIEATIPVEPEPEPDFDDPLAAFNDFGDADTEEDLENAQEDFLAEADPDDYVEEVLSQVSETRTETTVRRSPFLKNYHIEKRPLSSRAPVRETLPSADALPPTPRKEFREEEFARRADSVPDNAEEPLTSPEEKTGSRLGMAFTILVTILLGAGVGVFVYLVFFQ